MNQGDQVRHAYRHAHAEQVRACRNLLRTLPDDHEAAGDSGPGDLPQVEEHAGWRAFRRFWRLNGHA